MDLQYTVEAIGQAASIGYANCKTIKYKPTYSTLILQEVTAKPGYCALYDNVGIKWNAVSINGLSEYDLAILKVMFFKSDILR
jgi:hypothetical protein